MDTLAEAVHVGQRPYDGALVKGWRGYVVQPSRGMLSMGHPHLPPLQGMYRKEAMWGGTQMTTEGPPDLATSSLNLGQDPRVELVL